ncbi:hypothetical protein WICANDRAFT_76084 [Wickerhamomyces anomalus NRRL Y-366-8]|uniref:ATP-dependent Clp protease proteolytic subunit n=1 Tax=Wickerhamomyces anomalus (strain ATCC 58044 / CBS 1984 / NCYC 433 / NRRL Y-366-8) TaxID=683960 RepID=A0A1E3P904_WICAA|nr:uncharacterized protein WICANDRAFT_76084 [Wickerhamomyces anomalus NRRL Y-366-8]ODQ61896.1 hypothetical protein WICANDRAFT_76084 [Wickerhamomyces anomalus NRRL Y-366-8]
MIGSVIKRSSWAIIKSQSCSNRGIASVPFVINRGSTNAYDVFSKLLSERIIYLSGPIDDNLATTVTAQLLYLESQSSLPINIYINSPGGSVTAGLAIYDTMQYIRCEISTVAIGQAYSMASLLLAAGSQKKRFVLPNTSIMVHQPSGGFQGQTSDIEIHAKHIIKTRERLNRIYQKHIKPGTTLSKIHELLERDKFLLAEEAVELGLADRVLARREENEQDKLSSRENIEA